MGRLHVTDSILPIPSCICCLTYFLSFSISSFQIDLLQDQDVLLSLSSIPLPPFHVARISGLKIYLLPPPQIRRITISIRLPHLTQVSTQIFFPACPPSRVSTDFHYEKRLSSFLAPFISLWHFLS